MNMKQLYFRRALLKRYPKRPPRRLKRLLYPERIEAQYARALLEMVEFVKARIDTKLRPMIPHLVDFYGRVRKDGEDQPRKYYTAFIYEDDRESKNILHCTHKYLGQLSKDELFRAESMIDSFFVSPRKLPVAKFTEPEFFGDNKDLRVLTPEPSTDLTQFFPELRTHLDMIRKDDFPSYRPHVTTNVAQVDRPFSHYALISKDGIHRTWPKPRQRTDAEGDDLGDLASELEKVRLEVTAEYTPEEIKRLAQLTGRSVEEWNARQLSGQLRGIVEIDLFGGEPWLAKEMGAFVTQNVELIESISGDYLDQVGRVISTSVRAGYRVEEIADELADRFDVSESRATLIARDQVGKFNGQLTELRQTDLGIEEYIRRGVNDARERDSHRILNDQTFRWDDPPEVGHPGEDICCRCWGEPALAKFYESDDTE